jgi:Flp pilus assembly protein TadB
MQTSTDSSLNGQTGAFHATPATLKNEKTVGELFSDLSRELSTLVRKEVQLAQAELSKKVGTIAKSAGMIVAAVIFIMLALQALVACAVLALAQVFVPWLAALIVGGALILVAGVLAMLALRKIKKEGVAPKETIETIQEDVRWAKQQMSH